MTDFGLQRFLIADLGDQIEFGLQWLQALRLDLCFIHTTGVVVAYLLLVAAFTRVGILGRSFQNLVQHVAVLLVKNVCDPPGGIGRWDRIR